MEDPVWVTVMEWKKDLKFWVKVAIYLFTWVAVIATYAKLVTGLVLVANMVMSYSDPLLELFEFVGMLLIVIWFSERTMKRFRREYLFRRSWRERS